MNSIDWAAFTWQTFATLATGFAAVGAATFIGLRQHNLAREQAGIANRQAKTAEISARVSRLKLRADLFERRLEVYAAINAYLKAALSSNMDKIWDETPELEKQLVRAKFLFSKDVTAELEQAISDFDDLNDKKFERNEAKEQGLNVLDMNKEIRELRKRLRQRLSVLADTLGAEMRLYDED